MASAMPLCNVSSACLVLFIAIFPLRRAGGDNVVHKLPVHAAAAGVMAGKHDDQLQLGDDEDILPEMPLAKKAGYSACPKVRTHHWYP